MEKSIEEVLVDNRKFDEIIPDIINIVGFYVNVYYGRLRTTLNKFGYSREDVVQTMLCNLFNKTNGSTLSSIEKKFIQASEENLGMKYIRNVIGRAVYFNIHCLVRTFSKKDYEVKFDRDLSSIEDESTGRGMMRFLLEDKREVIEKKICYDSFVMSIENKIYKKYYVFVEGKYEMLTAHRVIDLMSLGLTISDMTRYVCIKREDFYEEIKYSKMSEIVKEVKKLLRKSYDEGNCLIDIKMKEGKKRV